MVIDTVRNISVIISWLLKNVWFIVTGNYVQFSKALEMAEKQEDQERRQQFIQLFAHLKPANMSSSTIASTIIDDILKDVSTSTSEPSSSNDWEREVECLEKSFFNCEEDDSGFLEETED